MLLDTTHGSWNGGEKVGTDNTMFIDAQDNYKNIRPFEKAIDEIQLKQYQI